MGRRGGASAGTQVARVAMEGRGGTWDASGSRELRVEGASRFLAGSKRGVASLRPLDVACKTGTIL